MKEIWLNPERCEHKFCVNCGSKLVTGHRDNGYDVVTGEKIIGLYKHCPKTRHVLFWNVPCGVPLLDHVLGMSND